jgi:hypothetical protein
VMKGVCRKVGSKVRTYCSDVHMLSFYKVCPTKLCVQSSSHVCIIRKHGVRRRLLCMLLRGAPAITVGLAACLRVLCCYSNMLCCFLLFAFVVACR